MGKSVRGRYAHKRYGSAAATPRTMQAGQSQRSAPSRIGSKRARPTPLHHSPSVKMEILGSGPSRERWWITVVVLVVALATAPKLGNAFVWDDLPLIIGSDFI